MKINKSELKKKFFFLVKKESKISQRTGAIHIQDGITMIISLLRIFDVPCTILSDIFDEEKN